MSMKKIAILGTGGFAREVLCLIQDINRYKEEFEILGFIDNSLPKGTIINGYSVIGGDNDIIKSENDMSLALAFGEPHLKKKVAERSLIHFSASLRLWHAYFISREDHSTVIAC